MVVGEGRGMPRWIGDQACRHGVGGGWDPKEFPRGFLRDRGEGSCTKAWRTTSEVVEWTGSLAPGLQVYGEAESRVLSLALGRGFGNCRRSRLSRIWARVVWTLGGAVGAFASSVLRWS